MSKNEPKELYDLLKRPDVNVTNAKDKETMLPVLKEIEDHVKKTFKKHGQPRPASVQTSAEEVSAFGAESTPAGERAPSVVACSPHSSTRGSACHMA